MRDEFISSIFCVKPHEIVDFVTSVDKVSFFVSSHVRQGFSVTFSYCYMDVCSSETGNGEQAERNRVTDRLDFVDFFHQSYSFCLHFSFHNSFNKIPPKHLLVAASMP